MALLDVIYIFTFVLQFACMHNCICTSNVVLDVRSQPLYQLTVMHRCQEILGKHDTTKLFDFLLCAPGGSLQVCVFIMFFISSLVCVHLVVQFWGTFNIGS